jgi:hypothetical protein
VAVRELFTAVVEAALQAAAVLQLRQDILVVLLEILAELMHIVLLARK